MKKKKEDKQQGADVGEPTVEGISSTTVWADVSDIPSSVCPQSPHLRGYCPLSWNSPSSRPRFQTGCTEPCRLCPPPLLSPSVPTWNDTHVDEIKKKKKSSLISVLQTDKEWFPK